jgi:hypothetical protein
VLGEGQSAASRATRQIDDRIWLRLKLRLLKLATLSLTVVRLATVRSSGATRRPK